MKKGDLVRLVLGNDWSEWVGEGEGYLWLVDVMHSDGTVTCVSIATGYRRWFRNKELALEQANEEG